MAVFIREIKGRWLVLMTGDLVWLSQVFILTTLDWPTMSTVPGE